MTTVEADTRVFVDFLVEGLLSGCYEAQTICAEALKNLGDDALRHLKPASIRRKVQGLVKRMTMFSRYSDISVQDALLECLATDTSGELEESIIAAVRHLPDFVDDILSLAIELRGQPEDCVRALHVVSCCDEIPGRAELRQLEKLAFRSRFSNITAKARELLVRFSD